MAALAKLGKDEREAARCATPHTVRIIDPTASPPIDVTLPVGSVEVNGRTFDGMVPRELPHDEHDVTTSTGRRALFRETYRRERERQGKAN
jgi:hypothetical protein